MAGKWQIDGAIRILQSFFRRLGRTLPTAQPLASVIVRLGSEALAKAEILEPALLRRHAELGRIEPGHATPEACIAVIAASA
jgi:hypothetical protein